MSLGPALGPAARARYGMITRNRNYAPADVFRAVDSAGKHAMLIVDEIAIRNSIESVRAELAPMERDGVF